MACTALSPAPTQLLICAMQSTTLFMQAQIGSSEQPAVENPESSAAHRLLGRSPRPGPPPPPGPPETAPSEEPPPPPPGAPPQVIHPAERQPCLSSLL